MTCFLLPENIVNLALLLIPADRITDTGYFGVEKESDGGRHGANRVRNPRRQRESCKLRELIAAPDLW